MWAWSSLAHALGEPLKELSLVAVVDVVDVPLTCVADLGPCGVVAEPAGAGWVNPAGETRRHGDPDTPDVAANSVVAVLWTCTGLVAVITIEPNGLCGCRVASRSWCSQPRAAVQLPLLRLRRGRCRALRARVPVVLARQLRLSNNS